MNLWRIATIFVFWLSVVIPSHAQQVGTSSPVTVIQGATLIDPVAGTSIPDSVIVIEGQNIKQIGNANNFKVPTGARVIDATGKTILPGMFSLHGHVGRSEGLESGQQFYNRERIQRDANAYLYYGITHMISLGLDWDPMYGFLADQRAGKVGGAHLYTGGLGFAAIGGWKPGGVEEINRPGNAQEGRELVRRALQKKPDVIKLWVDDQGGKLPNLSPEIYGAIIDEAHKNNVKVLVHLYALDEAKELMRRHVDALAHSIRDKEVDEEFLQLAKDNKVTQLTTLVGHYGDLAYAERKTDFLDDPGLPILFQDVVLQRLRERRARTQQNPELGAVLADTYLAPIRDQFEMALKNTAKINAAGIPIAIGTDSGGPTQFPGLWEHREMELLVRAGLTPMQAIQAATINGARFLGLEKKYGSLEPGKAADFVILQADPLTDITNSRKIEQVWMNGKPVEREKLTLKPSASLP
ncbi:MAG: hypothetical protein A3F68_01035 [Acidobacteria bacterium RIFCSPLOWO2_12_FULL_54_10]|nr:MAG: hypothetical protein A3F68_01035 [Acidobacteria bacterium RIFCSPLOWO2_12_FULL_54_10]